MANAAEPYRARRTLLGPCETGDLSKSRNVTRLAVEYVRVSTDTQAAEGLSIEAQQAAIEGYCALHGIRLVRICKDVMSGEKDQRPGSCSASY